MNLDITNIKQNRTNKRIEARGLKSKGLSYREISKKMSISIGTVSDYINNEEKPIKVKSIKKGKPANKKKAKERMLKSRYGLTVVKYNHMCINQNMKCAICGSRKELGGRKGLFVDHCHKTGKVRGLLCCSCNTAIGKLKEDKALFESAIRYLEIK